MSIQATVTVSFPVSDSDWIKLVTIRGLLAATVMTTKPAVKVDESGTVVELSAQEQSILDQRLHATHNSDESSILDGLEKMGAGKLKPNMTQEIIKFFQQNPGMTVVEAAPILMEMYPHVYTNGKPELARIKSTINNIIHSAHRLRKVGGKRGCNGAGKIYPVET